MSKYVNLATCPVCGANTEIRRGGGATWKVYCMHTECPLSCFCDDPDGTKWNAMCEEIAARNGRRPDMERKP